MRALICSCPLNLAQAWHLPILASGTSAGSYKPSQTCQNLQQAYSRIAGCKCRQPNDSQRILCVITGARYHILTLNKCRLAKRAYACARLHVCWICLQNARAVESYDGGRWRRVIEYCNYTKDSHRAFLGLRCRQRSRRYKTRRDLWIKPFR